MKSRIRSKPRRGVLILIVLSILVMFGLLGITFVIIAGQAKRTAQTAGRSEQQYDPPDRLAEEAALSIFRGSNNPGSPTWLHSLLEDIYGNDTVLGQTATVAAVCNGQLMNIAAPAAGAPNYPEKRVGCVLTMLNGPAANRSTRIVGYNPTGNLFQIVAFDDVATAALVNYVSQMPAPPPLNYIINGPAFTGTGVGYNPRTGRLDFLYSDVNNLQSPYYGKTWPLALLPRPFLSAQDYTDWLNGVWLPGRDGAWGQAGVDDDKNGTKDDFGEYLWPGSDDRTMADLPRVLANPDYTAADHQHPYLAVQLPNGQVPVPSFHRPELVNYWFDQMVTGSLINWGTITDPTIRQNIVLQPYGADGIRGTRDDPLPVDGQGRTEADKIADLKRRILLRPMPQDHPYFTGSSLNPAAWTTWAGLTAGTGPWDVDTDGDGIPDAIWVDFGFPVRALPDGRLVKPLVAPLIVDLDGRLNVNAHGMYTQTDSGYYSDMDPDTNYYRPVGTQQATRTFMFSRFDPLNPTFPTLPRGFGYGPAEINLRPLFANLGAYKNLLEARYQPARVPGSDNRDGSNLPVDDPLHINKWWEYGGDYWTGLNGAYGSPPNRLGDGAIGLDPGGRPLYLRMGRAAWVRNVQVGDNFDLSTSNHERLDDPYKLNLSKPTTVNSPFTPAELEAVLRNQPYEADAARLPPRLLGLGLGGHPHEITTESWHVPAPTFFIPKHLLMENPVTGPNPIATRPGVLDDLATTPPALGISSDPTVKLQEDQAVRTYLRGLLPGRSAQDLLAAKIYVEQRRLPTPAPAYNAMSTAQTLAPGAVQNLMPLELAMRLKMDVNRPFGNARDDNGNLVVDDPWGEVGEPFYQVDRNGVQVKMADGSPLPFFNCNQNAAPAGVPPGLWARQLYARHLYVLMMLLIDVDKVLPPGATDAEKARVVAQWAVNVVDFRDRDSIMTPFEYDIYPFKDDNGSGSTWNVDGKIGTTADPSPDDTATYRGLVWGCERPELLITETLGLHDRRAENLPDYGTYRDLPAEERPPQQPNPPAGWDPTFDQRKMPMASLFMELYHPWTALEPQAAELSNSPSGGVQLNRVVTDTADGSRTTNGNPAQYASPVWRMVIVPWGALGDVDPDPVDGTRTPNVERSVYFADLDTTNLDALLATERPDAPTVERFFWRSAADSKGNPTEALNPIFPGCYAVIGPRGTDDSAATAFTTYIGRRTGTNAVQEPSDTNQTRQVCLKSLAGANWVDTAGSPVWNNKLNQPAAAQIRQAVTIGINQPRRLNISDPPNGYIGTNYDPALQVYNPVIDTPLDYQRTDRMAGPARTQGTSLQPVAKVYLQRLADPTRGYNRYTNPYRTIDSMPIDLTGFNGWDEPDITFPWGPPDPPPQPVVTSQPVRFWSRQRGRKYDTSAPGAGDNPLWPQISVDPEQTTHDGSAPVHYFAYNLRHSLGYLNNVDLNSTDNFPPRLRNDPAQPNLGDPNDVAFPWLNWNNRPFVSEVEVLLVPSARSSMLLKPYDPANYPSGYAFTTGGASARAFPHLINYFRPTNDDGSPAPEFFRLFDLVGVPSPYVGMELQGKPDVFADTTGPQHTFYPPFNRIPNYREPGRLNVNTANSTNVWQGLMNDYYPGQSTCGFNAFAETRRGHSGIDMDTGFPTRFGDPVRSYAGQMLTTPPLPLWNLAGPEVNATLLRSVLGGGAPLFASGSALDCNNPSRNPFFRYQGLQRLGNLVTTRSNVFAVWITVGSFEVQPWGTIDPAHPDGYTLGQEAGADRGDIKRHRAFYIFDRSIPMGFQRGMDLNVEKGVLLKRYIE